MAGWHHRLDGRESQWTPGVGDGQWGLACCDSWGCKESDTTERLNWTDLKDYLFVCAGSQLWHVGSSIFILACGIFSDNIRTLSCGLWDLIPWPGFELGHPALGAQSLSHQTTREVPMYWFFILASPRRQAGCVSDSLKRFEWEMALNIGPLFSFVSALTAISNHFCSDT